MKIWQPMSVTVVGRVTDVVMGGSKYSGGGGDGGHGGVNWSDFSWFTWPF